jgi:hypothetical protein
MNQLNRRTEELLRDMRPPDELSFEDMRDRLEARERHPAIYRRFRDVHDAKVKEAEREADARLVWEAAGGDPRDFDETYKKMRAEELAGKVRAAEAQARADSWDATKGAF